MGGAAAASLSKSSSLGEGTAGLVDASLTPRQLASRARRRVREQAPAPEHNLSRQREVVDAFFAAAHDGDFDRLVAVLDPDVVLRAEAR
jgi:phosphomannomutase